MVTYNGIQDNVHALTLSNLQPAIECRRHRHAVALLRKLSAVESISRVQPAKGACLSSTEAACCLEPRSLEKQCRHICLGAGFPAYFLATYGHSGNLHTYMSTRAENSLLKSSADMPVHVPHAINDWQVQCNEVWVSRDRGLWMWQENLHGFSNSSFVIRFLLADYHQLAAAYSFTGRTARKWTGSETLIMCRKYELWPSVQNFVTSSFLCGVRYATLLIDLVNN